MFLFVILHAPPKIVPPKKRSHLHKSTKGFSEIHCYKVGHTSMYQKSGNMSDLMPFQIGASWFWNSNNFQAVSFDLPKLANEPCQSPGMFGWFSTGLGIRRFGCDTIVLEEFLSPPGIGISVKPLCLYIYFFLNTFVFLNICDMNSRKISYLFYLVCRISCMPSRNLANCPSSSD